MFSGARIRLRQVTRAFSSCPSVCHVRSPAVVSPIDDSKDLDLRRPVYTVRLALNKRTELVTACLLLPYQAQVVPVCFQRIGCTKAVLALPQKPVEEGVQNVNRNAFESAHRVLLDKVAVSGSAN